MYGDSRVRGSAKIDKNLDVGGSVNIAKELTVGGFATFNGGVSMGGNKIFNVGDGRIAPGSTDAVNGGQLWETRNNLTKDIRRTGARAAALAALKPLDYDPAHPMQFNVGYGNYKGHTAVAVGMTHYFNENVMLNVGGTIGDDPMINAGLSLRLGKEKGTPAGRKAQQRRINEAEAEIARLKEQSKREREAMEDKITLQNMRLTNMQEQLDQIQQNRVPVVEAEKPATTVSRAKTTSRAKRTRRRG